MFPINLHLELFCGVSFGIEYVNSSWLDLPDEGENYIVVDFIFIRVVFNW